MSSDDYEDDVVQHLKAAGRILVDPTSTARAIESTRQLLLSPANQNFEPSQPRKVFVMISRTAAVVVPIAALAAWLFWSPQGGSSVAFAQVQQAFAGTKTVSFKTTTEVIGRPRRTTTTMLLGQDRARKVRADGNIAVINLKLGEGMILNPNAKTAFKYKLKAKPDANLYEVTGINLYEEIRGVDDSTAEKLPEKTLEKKRVVGFRIRELMRLPADSGDDSKLPSITTEKVVWVDSQSKLPVQIDRTIGDNGKVLLRETSTDFEFDKVLDEGLFELTPPKGYSLEKAPEPRLTGTPLEVKEPE